MRRYFEEIVVGIVLILVAIGCNKKVDATEKESMQHGKITIMADETLTPIVDDQIAVFESEYDAKVTLVSKSEREIINTLTKDSIQVAILSRKLTPDEIKDFERKKINPRVTPFATDAIVLIKNSNSNDSLIALNDVLDFLKGKPVSKIKGLVFDNPNSSTVRQLTEMAGVAAVPQQGVYSFQNNEEAIKYVSENDGMIGVIGLNWIVQPSPAMQQIIAKIKVLSVKGINTDGYFRPTQNNIAEGKYPLARDLFIVNCQGNAGLGMGLSLFIAGDRGQRIVLKSGLLPVKIPGRKIVVRNKLEKENK